jgi:hypothetical protein
LTLRSGAPAARQRARHARRFSVVPVDFIQRSSHGHEIRSGAGGPRPLPARTPWPDLGNDDAGAQAD